MAQTAYYQIKGGSWIPDAGGPAIVPSPQTTTTVLAAFPVGTSAQGSPVTLTATVTSSIPAGSVQFFDGATSLGSVAVVLGSAQLITSAMTTLGVHTLTAVFTTLDPNYTGSTSQPVSYTITAVAAGQTVTTVTAAPPAPVSVGTSVTFTATVVPSAATGTVRFFDGATALSSALPTSSGVATFTSTALAVGNHTVTAQFTSAVPLTYANSTSASIAYQVVGTPVAPTFRNYFGTSINQQTSESVASAVTRLLAQFGNRLRYIRLWDDGTGPASLATGVSAVKAAGLNSFVSFKVTPASVLAGTHDAAFRTMIQSLKSNDFWSYYPSPDTDYYTGSLFTSANYKAAWEHLTNIQRSIRTDIYATLVTDEFSWRSTTTGRSLSDFFDPLAHDVLGFTVFSGGAVFAQAPGNTYPKLQALAAGRSLPWCVSDIASATFSNVNGYADRAAWYAANSDWLLQNTPFDVLVSVDDRDAGYIIDAESSSVTSWKNFSTGTLSTNTNPARFPGDPGLGSLFMGTSATGGNHAYFQPAYLTPVNVPRIGVSRWYPGGLPSPGYSTADWDYAINTLRSVPLITVQMDQWVTNGYAGIAAGNSSALSYLDALATAIKARAPWPIWICFQHEPDNPSKNLYGAASANYRAAKRFAYTYLHVTKNCTNLAVVDSCYMMFTFNTSTTYPDGSAREWRTFNADWKGTSAPGSTALNPNPVDFYQGAQSCIDIQGIDVYNTTTATYSASPWNLFSTQSANAFAAFKKAFSQAKPIAVGEYGSKAWTDPPYAANGIGTFTAAAQAKTRAWFDDAYQTALNNNVVALSYFNSYTTDNNMIWQNTGAAWPQDPSGWRASELHVMHTNSSTVLPS